MKGRIAVANMGGEGSVVRERLEGMGWRVAASILTFLGSMIAAILWLFFYAGSYSLYQNIAIFVVVMLAFCWDHGSHVGVVGY